MSILPAKKSAKKKTAEPKAAVAHVTASGFSHSPLRMRTVLEQPHISEKTARGEANQQYTFLVDRDATKNLVKDAVEKLYKVDVIAVNMTRLQGKPKRWRGISKKGSPRKKAIVTIKKGQKIEIV